MISFLVFLFVCVLREKGREGEREGEKHQCVVASSTPLTGDLAWNPGMCPDWELNQWCFGSQARAQYTELHQPGPFLVFLTPSFFLDNLIMHSFIQQLSKTYYALNGGLDSTWVQSNGGRWLVYLLRIYISGCEAEKLQKEFN